MGERTWVHQSGLLVRLQHSEQMEQDFCCLHLFSPVLNSVLAKHGSLTTTSEAIHSLSGTSVLLLPS